MNVKIKDRKR